MWSAATGKSLAGTLSHPSPVWSLAFSPGGRLLLTGCEDSAARVFVVATGTQIGVPLAHEGTVRAVAFRFDGTAAICAAAGGDGYAAARIWDIPPERSFPQWLFQTGGEITVLALGPDGKTALTGADDRTVRLWDLSTRRAIEPVMRHDDKITAVSISHDGRVFLTGDRAGIVRLWDFSDHRRPRQELRCGGWITSIALGPDDRTALIGVGFLMGVGGSGGKALLWDTVTAKVMGDPLPHVGGANWAAFSADGRTFVTADNAGVRLWDHATRRPLGERMGDSQTFPAAFFPDGKSILMLSGGIAHLWDVATGRVMGQPPFHTEGGIRQVALEP